MRVLCGVETTPVTLSAHVAAFRSGAPDHDGGKTRGVLYPKNPGVAKVARNTAAGLVAGGVCKASRKADRVAERRSKVRPW